MGYVIGGEEKDTDAEGYLLEADFTERKECGLCTGKKR